MNFQDSVAYLLSLGNEVTAMKLGLENIRILLAAIGDPQTKYIKVQVAGTNGKGSVCAFLNSICLAAGIEVGMFTSPHLISVTERIQINGKDISEEIFADLATRVRNTSELLVADGKLETVPTYFEQVTAMALLAFAEEKVEIAILETGLGGRYDATTAANAEIAAITRIDLDHQEYLGDTIEEIAAEKAAIIRSDTRAVIIAGQVPRVMTVIDERLRKTGSNVSSLNERQVLKVGRSRGAATAKLGLAGDHQTENANVAIFIVEVLSHYFSSISNGSITVGLNNTRHPGRLEYENRYLFDGAHNLGGAKALASFLFKNETRPITLVFGAMNDKSVGDILALLAPLAERIVLTQVLNSRSLTFSELLDLLPQQMSKERIFATDGVASAISIANEITPAEGIILVTGSLYLVGEVKSLAIG